MRRVTITISDRAFVEAKRQADEAGKSIAVWIAWLVETYEPPYEENPADSKERT